MDFKLAANLSLDDIRISILPLVIETWNVPTNSSVAVRMLHAIGDNSFSEVQQHRISI